MRELSQMRTLHSKTHDLGNGQHRLVASMIPMHYEENGQLLDIDMTIHDGVVNSGLYKIILMTDKIGFEAIDRGTGKKISVSLAKIGNNSVSYSAPTVEGNKAKWSSISSGVDVEFIFNPNQVHIFRILNDDQSEKSASWEIDEDLGEKSINMSNRVIGRDYSNNPTKHTVTVIHQEETTLRKKYTIHDRFDGKVFVRDNKTRVKKEFEGVQYPVRIDPTITVGISSTANDGYAIKSKFAGITTNTVFTTANSSCRVSHRTSGALVVNGRSFFRFQGITIAQSTAITSATLKPFKSNMITTLVGTILAKKLNNPVAPTNVAQVFTPGTLATNQPTKAFTTAQNNVSNINVTNLVQELINAFDYSSDEMLFFIKAQETPATSRYISFNDFSSIGLGGTAAQLEIVYGGGGGSSIKTWNGLADASTKTYNGLARASIKTFNGLA